MRVGRECAVCSAGVSVVCSRALVSYEPSHVVPPLAKAMSMSMYDLVLRYVEWVTYSYNVKLHYTVPAHAGAQRVDVFITEPAS